MPNKTFKHLLTLTLPMAVVLGCAHNRPEAEAVYSPLPGETELTATSARPEQRIYNENAQPAAEGTIAPRNAPPQGASPANWALAEEIRGKILTDKTLAPYPSDVAVEIGQNGTVILKGEVLNDAQRRRLHESIANLPGVNQVDDQVVVGKSNGNGRVNF